MRAAILRRRFSLAAFAAIVALSANGRVIASEPRPYWLAHVTLVDPEAVTVRPDMHLLIAGDRVIEVTPSPQATIPANAHVIDAAGKFLVPGLWDMHVHLSAVTDLALPLLVASGITAVRDMGGELAQLARWRDEIKRGERIGPRIFMAGPVVDGPRTDAAKYRLAIADPAGAAAAVTSLKASGADFLKVYHFLSRDSYFAIAREAKQRGMAFDGHVPNGVSAAEASDAGQRSIEHVYMLLQAHARLASNRGRPAQELTQEAITSLLGEEGRLLFRRFVRNGTWLTPTLVVSRSQLLRPELAAAPDPRRETIAASTRREWDISTPVPVGVTPEQRVERRRALAQLLEIVRSAHREGVALLAGTDPPIRDVFPGSSLHDELGLLVEAGLTPAEALRTATTNPVKFFGLEATHGSVAAGKTADFVILDANPIENIAHIRRIHAVVVGGRHLPRSELDAMQEKVRAEASKK